LLAKVVKHSPRSVQVKVKEGEGRGDGLQLVAGRTGDGGGKGGKEEKGVLLDV
jgi:hypothetical protein